ncbi:sensor histidine kinase [Pedobacter punctiformis]|uniref:Histidine kinase n=1 Tax=Pedobacter punctiformis TaxID=3004097 RepID=A0ABT4L474_9SPHI|nr:two-component regulator propeller domain-containing protein [Pedobacter sp. HCMS5-2]MCZ4242721.1 histidine kinase [Pedobacter sp. HCMS5-2]
MQAQSYVKRNTFTTNEGLPSNHIYDIVEDNKGFLWIATDNGVSRFDGKYFQNFSIKNGLPSNDVLQILKDGDGNIWANSYKQLPAYFDEIRGCFVTIKNHKYLNIISKTLLASSNLKDGSIKFYNQIGCVIFKNKKIIDYRYKSQIEDKLTFKKGIISIRFRTYLKENSNYLYSKDKLIDSIVLKSKFNFAKRYFTQNEIFQFTIKNIVYKISKINVSPLSYQLDSLIVPKNIAWHKFSNQNMVLTSPEGDVYVYDKNNLSGIGKLENNINANCAYIDRFKNIWVGTLDEGLAYYSNNKIGNINTSSNYVKPNFLSIAINDNHELFAGNYYGQILSIKNNRIKKFQFHNINYPIWIRKIICVKDKTVLIKDMGYSINFKPNVNIFSPKNELISLKTAAALNDSLIILGTIWGLKELNLNNGKTRFLNSDYDRALSLVKATDNQIYYLGPKGLYKYSLNANISTFIPLNKASLNENLSVLTFAKDSTLWASSLSGNLLIFKNDKIFASIKRDASLPENITCMLAHQNKIWIGSKKGIAILEYKFTGNNLNYTINNISKTDGLSSNTINDLAIKNDTVYVATENGISVVPANYQNPKFEISPELTDVKINQVNKPISTSYTLESNQNNITLQFAGIELSGHFKAIQYALNSDKNWSSLDGNTLNIQLNSGSHTILIRAVDVNNQISKRTLKLNFFIKTPFYRALWFWTAIAILITAITFWWFNLMKLQRQKTIFEQKLALELQRKKITADLHDDIGATLSSLQLNSAVANQLINTDTKQAKKILNKIEDQSKNLADKIGDIIWSMKPGKDEFMTISSRIKNFANDILGATNINYKILIDPTVNQVIRDISTRKNIVLITKEAVNNVVKYSCATEALISLKIKNSLIQLIIQDNGTGFNICEEKGNGLANMRKRTEELNGTFTINSVLKNGTTILVNIPLIP